MSNIPLSLANALVHADNIVRESVANLNGLPDNLTPAYIEAAAKIYAADQIAMALETLASANSDIAQALEKLAAVAGHAAVELAILIDRGSGK